MWQSPLPIEEVVNTGSQINCFNNCVVQWKSKPEVGALQGLGNLFMSTNKAFSGIPFK